VICLSERNSASSRRGFVRKLLGLVAVGGASTLLFGRQAEEAAAFPVSGAGTSGQVAYWTASPGVIAGFQSVLDPAGNNIAFGTSGSATGGGATVGGGLRNTASASGATVGGGFNNTASDLSATVGGGNSNTANAIASTVGGGADNVAGGTDSTVAGGYKNMATGGTSSVAGGDNNVANGVSATVGGGFGNKASGAYATIPGGLSNQAGGDYSFAAGSNAVVQAAHHGSMVFSDDTFATSGIAFRSLASDEFAVRATGGIRLVTGFNTSGTVTRQLTVSSSGFLGVSTSGPSVPLYALDLRTPGKSSAQMHISSAGADSGGYLTSANAANMFMSAGAAWNGSAWVAKNSSAYQYGGGPAGVRFFFDTGLTVGGTYTPTTRMFIGPTGNVGIGMSTQPGHLLQLGLDDAAKPSTSTWTIASDGRLKDPESIEPFTEGSELIKRLPQPVWFRYRRESGLPSDRRVAGWIAQDVAPVAPFMVRRTKQKLRETDAEETETLSLNTNELPYALVNSVRELLDASEQMKQQISDLKCENDELHAKTEQLEALHTRMERLEQALKSLLK
jgi:hypothetical protein